MAKLIFIDTETVNVDRDQAGIWQLAGIVVIDGEVKESFNFEMNPGYDVDWVKECIDHAHLTFEQIKSLPPQEESFVKFQALLDKYVDRYRKEDKFHIVAYNAAFDVSKLRAWWKRNDDPYFGSFFWSDYICVMSLASYVLKNHRAKFPNFKLQTVCTALNIELHDAHNATADIKATLELYNTLDSLLRVK